MKHFFDIFSSARRSFQIRTRGYGNASKYQFILLAKARPSALETSRLAGVSTIVRHIPRVTLSSHEDQRECFCAFRISCRTEKGSHQFKAVAITHVEHQHDPVCHVEPLEVSEISPRYIRLVTLIRVTSSCVSDT